MKKKVEYLSKKGKYEKVLFISDIHAPFHDKKALNACIAFGVDWKPDRIILMGDVVDFYAISSFSKNPRRALGLQKEIDSAAGILWTIRNEFPDVKIDYIFGNHENRLQSFLWKRASELSGLRSMTIPKLLDFEELNIVAHKTGRIRLKGLLIKHGDIVRKHSAYTAKGELENVGNNGISAHTHRLGVHYRTNLQGVYSWYEAGCLCRFNQEYMMSKVVNWQQGFAIGYLQKNHNHIHLISIIRGEALYGGYEYCGKEI